MVRFGWFGLHEPVLEPGGDLGGLGRHLGQGVAPVAYAVLLGRRDLGKALTHRRVEKDRIVAKAVVALGRVQDIARASLLQVMGWPDGIVLE